MKISQISCGLSGTGVVSKEGFVYVWGRFGKSIFNRPTKLMRSNEMGIKNEEDRFAEVHLGDEFVVLLSVKGEVFSFGENFENQLGKNSNEIPYLS